MENERTVLIVDDDAKLRSLLKDFLQGEHWQVRTAADGLEALAAVRAQRPSIIILDLMMPKLDGIEVCRRMRQTSQVPIIMLTARDDEVDKLLGLEIGADDYLVKPFSLRELAARMKAILRRTEGRLATLGTSGTFGAAAGKAPADDSLQYGELRLNSRLHTAELRGKPLTLTPIEFSMLELFMSHPQQVFNRLQILDATHGFAFEGYERTIDAHIRNLRKKIETDTHAPKYIQTVYGIGYRFGGSTNNITGGGEHDV